MFSDFTKLFVVGGYNGKGLDRVEVLDLQNISKTYNATPYPNENYGMTVGVIQNIVKVCGGVLNPLICYDYHAVNKTWVVSGLMKFGRINHAGSFVENYWLLSGSSGNTGGQKTTEIWTGRELKNGPPLPRKMHGHCQLTLNATHIFFGKADGKPNYLLDWPAKKWKKLEPTQHHIVNSSCGLIKSARHGREVVIAGYDRGAIFSFYNFRWRNGPKMPYFYTAAHTQLSDTFIVVGGVNISSHYLDTVYKFDNIKYRWIPLEQRLQIPAGDLGVVTVPDEVASFEEVYPDLAFNSKYIVFFKKIAIVNYNPIIFCITNNQVRRKFLD